MGLELRELHFWALFSDESKSIITLAENSVQSSQKEVSRKNMRHLPMSFREKIKSIISEGRRQEKKITYRRPFWLFFN